MDTILLLGRRQNNWDVANASIQELFCSQCLLGFSPTLRHLEELRWEAEGQGTQVEYWGEPEDLPGCCCNRRLVQVSKQSLFISQIRQEEIDTDIS